MKKLIRKSITCGINPKRDSESNNYTFDINFDNNAPNDVVQFIEPFYQESRIDDDVFWFGYKFNDGVDSDLRKAFIAFMKDVKKERWVDPEDEWSDIYFEEGGTVRISLPFDAFSVDDKGEITYYSSFASEDTEWYTEFKALPSVDGEPYEDIGAEIFGEYEYIESENDVEYAEATVDASVVYYE